MARCLKKHLESRLLPEVTTHSISHQWRQYLPTFMKLREWVRDIYWLRALLLSRPPKIHIAYNPLLSSQTTRLSLLMSDITYCRTARLSNFPKPKETPGLRFSPPFGQP